MILEIICSGGYISDMLHMMLDGIGSVGQVYLGGNVLPGSNDYAQ